MIEFAKEVAVAAGGILLAHYERVDGSQIRSKSNERDLVTAADLESERFIVERIRSRYPGHAIHAEESCHEGRRGKPCWFIDPLDGTINFIHSIPCFGVSIAYHDADGPLIAVVYLPRLGELFWARRGEGCWKDGRRIEVSRVEDLGAAIVATGFHYQRSTLVHNNLANFERVFGVAAGVRRMGSACMDLAYTACGRLDAFWELQLAPHDVAAGALLVREAGGIVSDVAGGQDWLFGKNIICGPPALHGALRELIEFGPEPR